jgi:CRISPR/Cas system CSM-associated protein Csm5 (group 7 of RAMP superfamily)
MNNPATSYQLTLTALSPVHVGGVQEKHLKNGIDFFVESGKVKILKWNEILNNVDENEIEEICSSLIAQDNLKLKQIAQKKGNGKSTGLSGNPTDIKTFIRNGLNQPFLPGSSLKGAISSILLNHLMDPNQKGKNKIPQNDIDDEVLGEFSKRVTHFIGISDINIPNGSLQFYPTKIFSLDNDLQGGWKHKRKSGTTHNFNDSDFVTVYECFKPLASILLRLNIYDGIGKFLEKHSVNNPLKKLSRSDNTDWCELLFGIINQYTRIYIEKEIKYFQKYRVEGTQRIIQSLESIKKQIPPDNSSCVLRMASGSGFYSITGDFMYEDHLYTINNPRKDLKRNQTIYIKYKTRRFAFENNNNQYIFYPMGFVKLSKHTGSNLSRQTAVQETVAAPAAPPPPPTPQYYTGKIKPYTLVQGICIGKDEINPAIKKFKLFIGQPGQEPVVELRYAADLDPNRLLKLTITGIQSGRITTIQFSGYVN